MNQIYRWMYCFLWVVLNFTTGHHISNQGHVEIISKTSEQEQYFESSTDIETGKAVPCRYFIGYDRDQNGKWGICVLCRDSVLDDGSIPNHIKAKDQSSGKMVIGIRWIHAFETCPRNIRLSLAVYLPNVISGLANAVKIIARQVDESIGQISEIEAQLKEVTA